MKPKEVLAAPVERVEVRRRTPVCAGVAACRAPRSSTVDLGDASTAGVGVVSTPLRAEQAECEIEDGL